jgi:hypothetical protein
MSNGEVIRGWQSRTVWEYVLTCQRYSISPRPFLLLFNAQEESGSMINRPLVVSNRPKMERQAARLSRKHFHVLVMYLPKVSVQTNAIMTYAPRAPEAGARH